MSALTFDSYLSELVDGPRAAKLLPEVGYVPSKLLRMLSSERPGAVRDVYRAADPRGRIRLHEPDGSEGVHGVPDSGYLMAATLPFVLIEHELLWSYFLQHVDGVGPVCTVSTIGRPIQLVRKENGHLIVRVFRVEERKLESFDKQRFENQISREFAMAMIEQLLHYPLRNQTTGRAVRCINEYSRHYWSFPGGNPGPSPYNELLMLLTLRLRDKTAFDLQLRRERLERWGFVCGLAQVLRYDLGIGEFQ